MRELRYDGTTDIESTTWVYKEDDGYVINVHHNIHVLTDAIALSVDVEPEVLGNIAIDTTYTMDDTWQSTSFRCDL